MDACWTAEIVFIATKSAPRCQQLAPAKISIVVDSCADEGNGLDESICISYPAAIPRD